MSTRVKRLLIVFIVFALFVAFTLTLVINILVPVIEMTTGN